MNRPITIISRTASGSTDDYGNATETETETATVGELQRQISRGSAENAQELSDTDWLLVLPAGTTIDTNDRIRVEDGRVFEVEGEPWHARNPRTGLEHHVEVSLRRVAGAGD